METLTTDIRTFIQRRMLYYRGKRNQIMSDEDIFNSTMQSGNVMYQFKNIQKINFIIQFFEYTLKLSDDEILNLFNWSALELDLIKTLLSDEHNQWNVRCRVYFICKMAQAAGMQLSPNLNYFCFIFVETFRGL